MRRKCIFLVLICAVENLYYTPKEILEYDEKGRQVAGGSAEGRIIWEYWENED